MKKNLYIDVVYLLFLGAITSLSLPPFNLLIINFLSFSLFFIFLIKKKESKHKLFFFYGWLFGFGYFLTNIYWISISLTFDENFKFLIPFALILVPSFIALFYGFVCYLFIFFKPNKTLSSILLFSVIFGFLEFIRGSILSGFPWNLIAYSFSNHLEILSITSLIGTYSFNLFCITLFLSPALFILRNDKKDLIFCLILPLIFLLFYFFGYSNKQDFYNSDVEKLDYKIRLVGTDISLDRFYSGEGPLSTIEDLINISSPNKKEKTIFIWPEGILPGISQDQIQSYDYLFNESFNENHLLILGINNKSEVNDQVKYYNSLSVYDHNLNLLNYYNKINLVPFGEFLPMENLLKNVGLKSLTNNYQSYSKGQKREIIELNQNNFSIKFLPLICYEIIYSGKLYKNHDFDIIVNISEDGWFGQSIGPEQHFVHSIFRAIESGKYVIRSANNGIAAIVNPLGIVEEKINFNEVGYIDFTKMRKIQPTVFSKYGNKIFGLIILLYIFLIFSFNRIKNE